MHFPKYKIITSIIVTLMAIIYILPNFMSDSTKEKYSWLPNDQINLGLDLKGGAHLLLEVDFDSYIKDHIQILSDNIRKTLLKEQIGYKNLVAKDSYVTFIARDVNDISSIKKAIKKIDRDIDIIIDNNNIKLSYNDDAIRNLLSMVVDQSIEIIRMRVDSTGTTEPILQRQGERFILLQVPGAQDPLQIKSVLGKTAKLTLHLVDDSVNIQEAFNGKISSNLMLVVNDKDNSAVVVKKKPVLGGDMLVNAQVSFDRNSSPVVAFTFNNVGAKIFGDFTKHNTGKRLAIVLDNQLLSAPVINEAILGGSGSISGNFTIESANELALLLRAGSLPAPLNIIEERTVGASLGSDSIESGKLAAMAGFAAVTIFMIWTYGIFGIFANIALSLALIYILALLTLLQATLTMPGIAGIVLTMGMAVDANVLIYERIKEEIQNGNSNLQSIKTGFKTAFTTIADSNITTLIVALVLYIFGSGAVKGFAVTLSIGIIASMFCAIIITKLLIDLWMIIVKPKKLVI